MKRRNARDTKWRKMGEIKEGKRKGKKKQNVASVATTAQCVCEHKCVCVNAVLLKTEHGVQRLFDEIVIPYFFLPPCLHETASDTRHRCSEWRGHRQIKHLSIDHPFHTCLIHLGLVSARLFFFFSSCLFSRFLLPGYPTAPTPGRPERYSQSLSSHSAVPLIPCTWTPPPSLVLRTCSSFCPCSVSILSLFCPVLAKGRVDHKPSPVLCFSHGTTGAQERYINTRPFPPNGLSFPVSVASLLPPSFLFTLPPSFYSDRAE